MKAGSLSGYKFQGNPKRRIMSLIKWVDILSADSPVVGKTSSHTEKMSTKVNKYLTFL
jgi:hypothetical protein